MPERTARQRTTTPAVSDRPERRLQRVSVREPQACPASQRQSRLWAGEAQRRTRVRASAIRRARRVRSRLCRPAASSNPARGNRTFKATEVAESGAQDVEIARPPIDAARRVEA